MAFSVTELGSLLPKNERVVPKMAEEGSDSFLWRTLDILNRPYSATMGAVTGALSGDKGPLEGARQGLTGEKNFSMLDVAGALGSDTTDPTTRNLAMLADVVNPLDPLNYVTFGFNKAGRVARGVSIASKEADTLTRAAAAAAGQWNPVSFAGYGLLPRGMAAAVAKPADAIAAKADRFAKTNMLVKHFGGMRKFEEQAPEVVDVIRGLKSAADLDERTYTDGMMKVVEGLRKRGYDDDGIAAVMPQVFDLVESPATRLARIDTEIKQINDGTWTGPLLPWKSDKDIADETASFVEDQKGLQARKEVIANEAQGQGRQEVLGEPGVAESTPAQKQPWEMTRDEFESSIMFHSTHTPELIRGSGVKPGSMFASTAESSSHFGSKDAPIFLVRSSDIKDIEAAESDVIGREVMKTGVWRRSGETVIPIGEISRAFLQNPHRSLVIDAIHSGATVPANVLADYPDLAKKYAKQSSAIVLESVAEPHLIQSVTLDPADPAPPNFMMRRLKKLEEDRNLAVTFRSGVAPDILNVADELAEWRSTMQDKYSVLKEYDPSFQFPYEDYMPHILPHNATRRDKRIVENAVEKERTRRTELASQGFGDDVIERMLAKEFRSERAAAGTMMTGAQIRGDIPAANKRKYDMTAKEAREARATGADIPQWNEFAPAVLDNANMQATRWRLAHDAYKKMDELGQTVSGDDFRAMDAAKKRDYVPIDFKVPWIDQSKNPFRDKYLNREAYDLLRKELGAANFFTGRAGQSALMETLHKARHWWVSWTLGPFPSTHTRNLVSDVAQNFLGGLNPVSDFAKAAQGDSSYMTAIAIAARNSYVPIADPNKEFAKAGITKLTQMVGQRFGVDFNEDMLLDEMRKRRILGDSTLRDDLEKAIDDSKLMKDARKNRSTLAKLGDFVAVNPDRNKVVQAGFKVGSKAQDFTRSALFVHALKEGLEQSDSLDTALTYAETQVRKHLFDYGDLTGFERDVMRLVIPFYTFTSKNLPLQIEKAVTDPGSQAWINRGFQGAWAGPTEDNELNYEDLPDWMQNAVGIPIRKMKDKDGNDVWSVSTLRGWLPQTELNELADAMRGEKFLGFFAERMNPVFKEFFEQAMNYDSYIGRAIDEGQTVEMGGIAMDPRAAHLIRNVRLFNELDKMNPLGLWTEIWEKYGANEGAGRPHRREAPGLDRGVRQLTGLNFYTVDAEKEANRRMGDAVREIQKKTSAARISARLGQTKESEGLLEDVQRLQEEARAAQQRLNQVRGDRAKQIARKHRSDL